MEGFTLAIYVLHSVTVVVAFKTKVYIKDQWRDGSISHFINKCGLLANTSSPSKKKKKSSKKTDHYKPTMEYWIDMYQKSKDAKDVNRIDLNP